VLEFMLLPFAGRAIRSWNVKKAGVAGGMELNGAHAARLYHAARLNRPFD
jgi:hypothetical protein